MQIKKAVVTLFGMAVLTVSTGALAQTASDSGAAAASAAKPVQSSKAANRKLSRDVRRALAHAKDVSIGNITVRAASGAVTLAGTVPDETQVDKATRIAQGVAGVTSVRNALTVRPVGQ
ncbi:BON domain-containing protein [Caballeronia ptereochthonis]|uniref:Transport-associated protein n=1 Tax=Caballeronia ptereochthonis TaxID=1777144 RepID=A0A158CD11_9BURK|nr:BON domain-containing protein [Caballeronia ptereochthonis]SAK79796.1 transport-associated protein [Caballeronia ptereochthonis]